MEKVLITGGTGLIGKRLSYLLQNRGYEVRLLSRSKNPNGDYKTYLWDIEKGYIDENAFEDLNYIIHLAGAGIADKRWTEKRKQIIIDSRVITTDLLLKTVKQLQTPLKAFISASAVGYYGSFTSETIFEESHKPSDDFLGKVCRLWEESTFQFQQEGIRTVALRTGIVLSNHGGALAKMKTPIITPLGDGKQYMPWIHIDDMCALYIKAMKDDTMKGAYNTVAPEFNTNKSFSKAIAKAFNRPFIGIGVPQFILKLVLGEMATVILHGSRVSSKKVMQAGFEFEHTHLDKTLASLKTQQN